MSKYKKVLAALAMGGFFTASAPAAQADDLTPLLGCLGSSQRTCRVKQGV